VACSGSEILRIMSPVPRLYLMIAARRLPGDRNGNFQDLVPRPARHYHSRQGASRGRSGAFSWCKPKGRSAPFSIYTDAREGFAGSRDTPKEKASEPLRCGVEDAAARLIRCGNWRSADESEVRSCTVGGEVSTLPTPVSGLLRRDPFELSSARSATLRKLRNATTITRRPESRRGPRIGADLDPVARASTIYPPAHVSKQSSLFVMARIYLLSPAWPSQSGRRAKRIMISLEGIADDTGL
jgi:hypothetical protein